MHLSWETSVHSVGHFSSTFSFITNTFFTIRPGFLLIMPLFIQIPHPQCSYLLKLPYSLMAKLRVILILLACINITHLFIITEPPLKFLYTTWNTLPYMTGISNGRNWPLREHINQNPIRKKTLWYVEQRGLNWLYKGWKNRETRQTMAS